MNNEIKEILNYYRNIINDKKETYTVISKDTIYLEHLLDYITNLQQENERIKKMNMHEHKYGSDMEEKYLIEKVKNDRAVEYIENNDFGIITFSDRDINGNLVRKIEKGYVKKDELLNILNGRSDE